MSPAVLERGKVTELVELLEEKERRLRQNMIARFTPYPWQREHFSKGSSFDQRLLMAGNRTGKTFIGAVEMSYHLTGRYPDNWTGRVFDHPILAWAGSDTAETTRDGVQKALFGEPGNIAELGTGTIPKKYICYISKRPGGVDGAISFALIRHVSGQFSKVQFKSYDQGRARWQVAGVDYMWLDEEPDEDIYGEAVTRTMDKGGALVLTFTPLRGISSVVKQFVNPSRDAIGQAVTQATWDDAPHLTDHMKKSLWGTIPPHQREARSKGIPSLGSGQIYPVAEEVFVIDPIKIPEHWPRIFGLDVGWNRTAAVWGAWDRDADIVYLFSEHYLGEAQPPIHASAVKARGAWIPGMIDPAARGRSQVDGKRLLQLYRDEGLKLTPADNSVEAGIYAVWTRLSTGRLKVFNTLASWLKEFRMYHRDEKGRVSKADDHLMDATRYLVMGLGSASTEPSALNVPLARTGGWMSS
ncbi:MAG: terminase large subunit [Nitrospinota bacterium]|nr:terminase large subunit [Nitrospinota bacterium]